VCKRQAVRDFANAPITNDILFLFLDALTVLVEFGLKAKKVKLSVGYGIHGMISCIRAPIATNRSLLTLPQTWGRSYTFGPP
jgi:hypothetical protein